jgi:hypothetical protein
VRESHTANETTPCLRPSPFGEGSQALRSHACCWSWASCRCGESGRYPCASVSKIAAVVRKAVLRNEPNLLQQAILQGFMDFSVPSQGPMCREPWDVNVVAKRVQLRNKPIFGPNFMHVNDLHHFRQFPRPLRRPRKVSVGLRNARKPTK